MHWPRLLADDPGDNDPEMAEVLPDPQLIAPFSDSAKTPRSCESISGLTSPLRVKCWCKIFPTYLTLSSELLHHHNLVWMIYNVTFLRAVQYCSKACNVSAPEKSWQNPPLNSICVGMLTMPRSPNVQILNRKRRDGSHNGHLTETFWGTKEFRGIHGRHTNPSCEFPCCFEIF